jgi:LIVCS family branched-chain amino acid:cation transporter
LHISPTLFSAFACALIFLLTVRKTRVLTILGWGLTPFLLFSLLAIIGVGLIGAPAAQSVDVSSLAMFFHGLSEGYNTMDLLAAFFFSSTVIGILKTRAKKREEASLDLKVPLKASLVAGFLLTCIYIGFSYIASYHGGGLSISGKDELLAAITFKIAGPYAGFLVCVAVALACLTTAIALITAFADFMQKEVCQGKVSYEMTLAVSLLVTFCVSTFEFTQISAFLWPILQVCYPGLIVLTIVNIGYYLLRGCFKQAGHRA